MTSPEVGATGRPRQVRPCGAHLGSPRGEERRIVQRGTARVSAAAFAVVLCLFALCIPAFAQQRKTSTGPRAVGLFVVPKAPAGAKKAPQPYLIPITLWFDSRYYDAQLYGARPQPMALDGGVVYEVRRGGDALGLFTIDSLMHQPEEEHKWFGGGQYRTMKELEAREAARAARNTTPTEKVIGEGPPRLRRSGDRSRSTPPPTPAPSSGTGSTTQPGNAPASEPAPSGDDRPVLHRAPSSESPAPAPSATAASAPTPSATTPAAPPAVAKSDEAGGKSDEDDPNRPRLHRSPGGEPQQIAPAIKPATTASKSATSKAPSSASPAAPARIEVRPLPPAPEVFVAISDAKTSEPHSFNFEWSAQEKERLTQAMLVMANAAIDDYLSREYHMGTQPSPAPARARTRRTVPAPPPAPPQAAPLDNVDLRALDLYTDNYPELVLTAQRTVSVPTPDGGSTTRTVYVTLAEKADLGAADRRDQFRKLLSYVTDDHRLDDMPQLKLIDGVDADGDGVPELLFSEVFSPADERNPQAWGFRLYRVGADSLEKLYDSEGKIE